MLLGFLTTRLFKLPSWTTPALCFNNTTSLPLLLIQSLDSSGILSKLLMSENDTSSAAVARAKSYFLVCAIVANAVTFAIGPRLLDVRKSPEEDEHQNNSDGSEPHADGTLDGNLPESSQRNNRADPNHDHAEVDEQTSLLPGIVVRHGEEAWHMGYRKGKKQWDRLHPWAQSFLDFSYQCLTAPLIGALIGALIGLTPPLHRAFFNEPQKGGIFKAWLTDSVSNLGQLFAALQVLVVGVRLSSSLRKMKRGDESGTVPWGTLVYVLTVRFILWPM